MKVLNEPIQNLSFKDIVSFCKEGHSEGPQIDYKKDFPRRGLAKHFAAFSNTRGGLIIVGVEEDRKTGKPKFWNGIKNDGKLEEKVHQQAANVEPRPRYGVSVTDESKDKVFLLIRIFEGDRTPYYVQNDGNLWVRTGSISDPITIANPDHAELLIGKKNKAEKARETSLHRAQVVFREALARGEKERVRKIALAEQKEKGSGAVYYQEPLGSEASFCTVAVQPFHPREALITPQELKDEIGSIRAVGRHKGFPSLNNKPIPNGVLMFDWAERTGAVASEQLYSTGLVHSVTDLLRVDEDGYRRIWIASIAETVFIMLRVAAEFYQMVGYQGGVKGLATLENAIDVYFHPIVPTGYRYDGDLRQGFLSQYDWRFELDTQLLNDDKKFLDFYLETIREVYWDLGYEKFDPKVLEVFLKQEGWLK